MPDLPQLPRLPDLPGPVLPVLVCGLVVVLAVRRVAWLRQLVSAVLWLALLGLGAVLLAQRAELDPWLGRYTRLLHLDDQEVAGGTVKVRMGADGHFWARVTMDGVERRMLVDSGATVTALSLGTARAAGLDPKAGLLPVLLHTANGTVTAKTVTIPELALGDIRARRLAAVVSPGFGDMDVLGMNFLSRLKSWTVEDGVLVMVPHHPVEAAGASGAAAQRHDGGGGGGR